MPKTIQQYVTVHTPQGDVNYAPGDVLDSEHADLVTNEQAFTETELDSTRPVPGFGQRVYVDVENDSDTGDGAFADRKVPQLRNLAKAHDVDLEGAKTKDDIVQRLTDAGVDDGTSNG